MKGTDKMEKTMVLLNHPCYKIDIYTAESEEDEEVLRGQGYIELMEALESIEKLKTENEILLEVVKAAYQKHHLDDMTIGWDELSDILLNALCETMGDDGYVSWVHEIRGGE